MAGRWARGERSTRRGATDDPARALGRGHRPGAAAHRGVLRVLRARRRVGVLRPRCGAAGADGGDGRGRGARGREGDGDGGVPPRRTDPGDGDARGRGAGVGYEDAEQRGELRRGGSRGGGGGVQREWVLYGERRRGGTCASVGLAERGVREGVGGRSGGARASVRCVGMLSGRGGRDGERVGEQDVGEGLGVRRGGRRSALSGVRREGAVLAGGLWQPVHRSLFVVVCLLEQTEKDSIADRSG